MREIDLGDRPFYFAGQPLDFSGCDPIFETGDRRFIECLDGCRQSNKGAAIIYIDRCDENDNGFHYSLLRAVADFSRKTPLEVIPLPIFAHIMGCAEPAVVEKMAEFLAAAFEGRVFFASMSEWRASCDSDSYQKLVGAPEACSQTIALLKYLSVELEEVDDPSILELLSEVRKTPIEEMVEQQSYIDDGELVGMMKRIAGVRKLGYPPPPRTREELRNYWLR